MPETKTSTQFLSGNFEHPKTLRRMQEWPGHKSSKTIVVYTYVSNQGLQNIKNPFDDLEI